MMDNKTLTAIVSKVAREFKYEDAGAEFQTFKEFRIRWSRTYTWVRFEVSDYLAAAPEDILESVFRTLFKKIKGDEDAAYTDEARDWFMSEDFRAVNQPKYIDRIRGFGKPAGEVYDLDDIVADLEDEFHLPNLDGLVIGWEPKYRTNKIGNASTLMRVVGIPGRMDDGKFPEEVLRFIVFLHLAHISLGFDPDGGSQHDRYEEILDRYPDRKDLESGMVMMDLDF